MATPTATLSTKSSPIYRKSHSAAEVGSHISTSRIPPTASCRQKQLFESIHSDFWSSTDYEAVSGSASHPIRTGQASNTSRTPLKGRFRPPPRSEMAVRSSIGRLAPRNGFRSGCIGMHGKRSSVAPAPGASTFAPTGRMWDTAPCDSMWEASKRPPSHARGVRAECGGTSSIAPDGAGSAVPGNRIIVRRVPGSSECCYTVGTASDQAAMQIIHQNQISANPITIGGHLNRMESLPNVGPTVPLSLRTRAFDGMLSLGRAREKDSLSGPPTPGAFPTVSRPMTPWGQDQAPAKLLSHGPLTEDWPG